MGAGVDVMLADRSYFKAKACGGGSFGRFNRSVSPFRNHHCIMLIKAVSCSLLSIMAMAETRKFFELLIVIEPHLIPRKVYEHAMREGSAMAKRVVALRRGILARRDTWPTKEYALQWLSTRMPWKLWDKNILQIYVVSNVLPWLLAKQHR
jgi:hypothetical protein